MSLNLSQLKPKRGATKGRKRVGRGNGSGMGTYCCRGQKGQGSRKGSKFRSMFEGGQTSFLQRMPKLKGFTNPSQINYTAINLGAIDESFKDGEEVNSKSLHEKGMIRTITTPYAILGAGELTKKVKITAHKISGSAKVKVEKLKIELEIIPYTKKSGKDLKEAKK